MEENRKTYYQLIKYISFALAALHLLALTDMQYDYYVTLRWLTCIGSIVVLVIIYNLDKEDSVLIIITLIAASILWNPINPIYMDKSSWNIFNIIYMIWMGLIGYVAYQKEKEMQ